MPKPVKKKAPGKLPVPPKTKRPTDPNRAAKSMVDEHMARATTAQPSWAKGKDFGEMKIEVIDGPVVSFEEQYKAHMKKLGKKGGDASGKARMTSLTSKKRSEVALKAARARWSKRKDQV